MLAFRYSIILRNVFCRTRSAVSLRHGSWLAQITVIIFSDLGEVVLTCSSPFSIHYYLTRSSWSMESVNLVHKYVVNILSNE